MRALVLGAGGVLGVPLCEALLERGYMVTGVVLTTPRPASLGACRWRSGPGAVGEALADGRWDLVVDLRAWRPTDLADIATRAGAVARRWVHVSSIYVYRRLRDAWNPAERPFLPVPIPESTPRRPSGIYGEGKLACELAWEGADIPVDIVRLPFVFGRGDRSARGRYYADRIAGGARLALPQAGRTWVDILFAPDAARSIVQLCERTVTSGCMAVNVAGPPRTLRDHVEAIAEALGRPAHVIEAPEALDGQDAPPFAYPVDLVLDRSKLRALVGESPPTALGEAWSCALRPEAA